MHKRLLIPFLSLALPLAAQQEPAANWRQLLEQALFARTYQGDPDAAERLFAAALAAAKASGDAAAEQEVLRQQQGAAAPKEDHGERILRRVLLSIAGVDEAARQTRIDQIDWDDYVFDDRGARVLARCLDSSAWLGENVELRIEDLMQIVDNLAEPRRLTLLTLAMQSDDAYVRNQALRLCDDDRHAALIDQALTDPSQGVRELACQMVSDDSRPARKLALQGALDLQTRGAIQWAFQLPGFADRMRAAGHDSWLATTIVETRPDLDPELGWATEQLAKVEALVDWAAAAPGPMAARQLSLASDWLRLANDDERYPAALARRVIALALDNAASFSGATPGLDEGSLGYLVYQLGTLDDLLRWVPAWCDIPERQDDALNLTAMCERADIAQLPRLLQLGVTLTERARDAEKGREQEAAEVLYRHFWEQLGRFRWPTDSGDALDRAFATIDGIRPPAHRAVYAAFVNGVQGSRNAAELFGQMEARYARYVLERHSDSSDRARLTFQLVDGRSKGAPAAALSLIGQADYGPSLGANGNEKHGDFLIRACAIAPDAALDAVLARIRSGADASPEIRLGTELTRTNWPQAYWLGGGGAGINATMPILAPQPPDHFVVKQQDRTARLPSLLWVLPPDQAAQGAAALWNDALPRIGRQELIETLLFAQASRHAIELLVTVFDEIDDPATQARVLAVFGKMLHEPARPLIARALDSDEPIVRQAALEAAQKLLAYRQAREAMGDGGR